MEGFSMLLFAPPPNSPPRHLPRPQPSLHPPPQLPLDLTKSCINARTQYLSLVAGLALFFLVVRNKNLSRFIR